MAVTYDYYRIFYYVAKYRNFTKAAQILMNSQPNITRAMNNLEHELGCRLLVRSNRGVSLTPEGERLYVHVAAACEQLQEAEEELGAAIKLQKGSVSIGVSETALHEMLLPKLRQFRNQYPNIHLKIYNYSTPQAVESVKNGLVNFAAVTSPTGVVRPLKEIPVQEFQEILVAGSMFEELKGKSLSLCEAAAYPLICLGKETKTYEFYSSLFRKYGMILEPEIEAATTDQILPMIKNDLGIGFLPESFASEALSSGEIFQIELKEEIPKRSVCIVKDTRRPSSVAARELEKLLTENAVQL